VRFNPPRIVATWAVENYYAQEIAQVHEYLDELIAKHDLRVGDSRIPWSDDGFAFARGRSFAAMFAGRVQRYADKRTGRLLPHVLR